nr:MAG TPA: hypothetical protein [Bacteriophage sp.]
MFSSLFFHNFPHHSTVLHAQKSYQNIKKCNDISANLYCMQQTKYQALKEYFRLYLLSAWKSGI